MRKFGFVFRITGTVGGDDAAGEVDAVRRDRAAGSRMEGLVVGGLVGVGELAFVLPQNRRHGESGFAGELEAFVRESAAGGTVEELLAVVRHMRQGGEGGSLGAVRERLLGVRAARTTAGDGVR